MKIKNLKIIIGFITLLFCSMSLANVDLKFDADELLIIKKARKRLYNGGYDEQDLEVQSVLLKPQRKGSYLNAESPEQTIQDEDF